MTTKTELQGNSVVCFDCGEGITGRIAQYPTVYTAVCENCGETEFCTEMRDFLRGAKKTKERLPFADLADLVEAKKVRMKVDEERGLSLYKYTRKSFFNNDFSDPRMQECRGLVLDSNGVVVQKPFRKLFNYGEENCPEIDVDSEVVAVQKINGFMLAVSNYNGQLLITTTGSFENDYIELAKKHIHFNASDLFPEYTYLFEVVDPADPHIVPEFTGMYLIGVRSNLPALNEGYSCHREDSIDKVAERLRVLRPAHKVVKFSHALEEMSLLKTEGYIVRKNDLFQTPLCKLKTDWYRLCKVLARSEDARCLSRAEVFTRSNPLYLSHLEFVRANKSAFFSLSEQERLNALRTMKLPEVTLSTKNVLFLVRGLPGSGKSTLARLLCSDSDRHVEADMFFVDSSGVYNYKKELISEAHKWCIAKTEELLRSDGPVYVCNTFTTEKEIKPYIELAKRYGFTVVSLIVENRHEGVSVHDVPEETLMKMKERFNVCL